MCCKSFGVTNPIRFKEWLTLVSRIFSTLSFVSDTDSFAFSVTLPTVVSAKSPVLDSSSSPTLTKESNSLLPSSSAREKAPSPANQICLVYFLKSKADFLEPLDFNLFFSSDSSA
ncbi:hypothetical protein D9M73_280500 [compost metagenome]